MIMALFAFTGSEASLVAQVAYLPVSPRITLLSLRGFLQDRPINSAKKKSTKGEWLCAGVEAMVVQTRDKQRGHVVTLMRCLR